MYFRTNNKYLKDVSLNDYVGYDKDGNEISIMDIMKIESTDFTDEIALKDNIKLLKKYMSVLNDREKSIINRRYGLDNREEETKQQLQKKKSGLQSRRLKNIESK